MSDVNKEKQSKTIQEKLTELSELVEWFQSPDFSLELALTKYKKAEKLADEIETELMQLKNEITIVTKRFDEE